MRLIHVHHLSGEVVNQRIIADGVRIFTACLHCEVTFDCVFNETGGQFNKRCSNIIQNCRGNSLLRGVYGRAFERRQFDMPRELSKRRFAALQGVLKRRVAR